MTRLEDLFATRGTIVRDAISAAAAGELRGRLDRAGYRRYALLDRGSYDELRGPVEPELLAGLAGLAAQVIGRELRFAEARALRLGPGDYLLAHHDSIDDTAVELILDVSAAGLPGTEVHYRRNGAVFFRFESVPGALSIVERGPTVTCSHGYVSKRHVGAELVRLVVRLHAVQSRDA